MIQDFINHIPRTLNNRSGKVFYSGKRAFESPKALYVLGGNPAGDPDDYPDETVASHTKWLLESGPDDWSAYRDESWKDYSPGEEPMMQQGMLHMFQKLNLDPGEVPASNLLFVRSKSEAKIKEEGLQLLNACWPFHQAVVEKLKVCVVLCLGNTYRRQVCDRLGAHDLVCEFTEDNCRGWKSQTYRNTTTGVTVIAATHPSRAKWRNPKADPTGLVQRALK